MVEQDVGMMTDIPVRVMVREIPLRPSPVQKVTTQHNDNPGAGDLKPMHRVVRDCFSPKPDTCDGD
jgi:hypothetical protein